MKKEFKLINGEFNEKDAYEVLYNIFSEKLKFHKLKNFISQERYGIDNEISTKKIPELKKFIDEIEQMHTEFKGSDITFKISATVNIELIEK